MKIAASPTARLASRLADVLRIYSKNRAPTDGQHDCSQDADMVQASSKADIGDKRQHGYRIDQATVRNRLAARREPYWMSLGKGRAIGFRKSAVSGGAWVGRWTEPSRDVESERPKYRYEALGSVLVHSYSQAVEAAQAFFVSAEREWKRQAAGGIDEEIRTIEDGCRARVKNRRIEKGDGPADEIETHFKAHIYDTPFGRIPLDDLTAIHVERWRNSLVTPTRKKNSVNRIYCVFAAAMNYCKKLKVISSDEAWTSVGEFKVKDGKRNHYLTDIQVREILFACDRPKTAEELAADKRELRWCTPDLGTLIRGWLFTGSRPSELVKARVRDLNVRECRLTLVSAKNKDGVARPRDFFLYEPAALSFFTGMAGNKRPAEYLMTKEDGSAWVNEKGEPMRHQWGRGMRAAVRDANTRLKREDQIPDKTVAYTARHKVITDLLSEDNIDSPAVQEITGTSDAMIKENYYKVVAERLKTKLSRRRSF